MPHQINKIQTSKKIFVINKTKFLSAYVIFFIPFIVANFEIISFLTTRKLGVFALLITIPFALQYLAVRALIVNAVAATICLHLAFYNINGDRFLFASAIYGSCISIFIVSVLHKYLHNAKEVINYLFFSICTLITISFFSLSSTLDILTSNNLRVDLKDMLSINSYSTYNLLCFSMCLIGIDFSKNKYQKILFGLAGIVALGLSCILISRQVIATAAVAILIYIGVKNFIALFLFVFIVIYNYLEEINLIGDIYLRFEKIFEGDGSTSQRLGVIGDAVNAFKLNPFGYGPGASLDIPSLASSNSWGVFESWYLEIFVAYGIFSIIFFLGYLIFLIRIIKSKYKSLHSQAFIFSIIFLANEFGYDASFGVFVSLMVLFHFSRRSQKRLGKTEQVG